MPRIRTIKPEFWTDEKVIAQSPFARLLFIGLWNFADDEGYMMNEPVRLRWQILPSDDVDISALLDELVIAGLVEVVPLTGDRSALWIPHFGDHQRISKSTASRISPEIIDCPEIPATAPENPGKRPRKGKEREGKGIGTKGRKIPTGDIATGSGESAQGDTCGPAAQPKRGRRPAVAVEDATFPPGLDTPAGRVALERWLTHKRAIRKGYRSVSAVDQLLKQWADKSPAEFAAAVDHSIGNEYQGLFGESSNGRKPKTPRFGPGQKYDPDAGVGDPAFGKL